MSRAGLFARYDRDQDDWYVEEEVAVEALLAAEDLRAGIYDPSCGRGTIPRVAQRRGIHALGSDKRDRGFGRVRDFLAPGAIRRSFANIVCNPPYGAGLPEAFCAKALRLVSGRAAGRHHTEEGARDGAPGGLVCLLLPFAWYSSIGRRDLFARTPLARVRCFAYRVNMPPGRLLEAGLIAPENGKQTYAWFIWDPRHPIGAPPLLYRIEEDA